MKKLKNKQAKKASKLAKAENMKQHIITVKNAEGDPDTKAEILIQNKINYTPKVSVIIPVYNVEEYLRECLDSVVNQTLKEIEIICVDDGSTDNSLEILKEYAKKDSRITVITQQNLHAGVARNAGLAVARGEYLSFLDSDDFFELNMLEETYNKAKQDDADIVVFNSYEFDSKAKKEEKSYVYEKKYVEQPFSPMKYKDYLYFIAPPVPWNKIYKTNLIKKYKIYFEALMSCNDITFVDTALSCAKIISVYNRYFVHYRKRQNNISAERQKYSINILEAFYHLRINLEKYKIFDIYKNIFYRQLIARSVGEVRKSNQIKKKEFFLRCNEIFGNEITNAIQEKLKASISVIIPIYNAEKYLRQCLDSVVNQTLRNIEIICIDDKSTDNSLQILQEYASKDGRIIIINNKTNLGAPGAVKNIGIQRAKGEYIGFVDSDDWVESNYFEILYNAAKNHKADIAASTKLSYVLNNNIKTKHIDCPDSILITPKEKEQLIKISGSNWNKIYKRSLIEKNQIKCCEIRNIAEDNIFSCCAMVCANKIVTTSETGYFYRKHEDSITAHQRTIKDFDIFLIYKNIEKFVEKKDKKYISSIKAREVQDFKWFYNDCINEDKQKFKKELNKNFPEAYNMIFNKLIISLTSYPARINTVNQTIESLLNQTMKADKVILWLAPEQFPNKEKDLPSQLLELKEKGLTIDWYHDIKSYKKLIPTLKKYPDAIIVTADDDILYNQTCIEKLLYCMQNNRNCVIAHRITRLKLNQEGIDIFPRIYYTKNNQKEYVEEIRKENIFNMQTGCGAVLYPPHCFYKDISNEDLIMQLAPTNDDQWFWAMGLLNGFKVMVCPNNEFDIKYVPNTQDGQCLWKINDRGEKLYFKDLKRILEYYPVIKNMLKEENSKNNKIILSIFLQNNKKQYIQDITNWYRRATGKYLNINTPRTYNEKMQWLKLYNSTPIKTRLADKYLVRDWVKEKIGEQYLIPLLGVYDKFEDIDFAKLPNQFVIKCNHGSGWNIIVKDKSKLDLKDAKEKLDKWMNTNFAFSCGYELHYKNIKPKIIIEKYINPNISNHEIQCWVFNKEIKFVSVETIKDNDNLERGTFYPDGKRTEFEISPNHYKRMENISSRKAFDKAIELAQKLIVDVPYVRIDFIEYQDDVRFREMTFTSGSGLSVIKPDKYNLILGNMIKLPKLAYNIDTGEYYKLPKKSKIKPWLLLPYNLLKQKYLQEKYQNMQCQAICHQLKSLRIDIKNFGKADNDIDITTTAKTSAPAWFANEQGRGRVVESVHKKESLTLKCRGTGKLRLDFKAADKRCNGTRFPLWVDYKSIKINGKEQLSSPVQTWHDKPYRFEMPVKDGQVVTVEIVQQYHQYAKDELQDVILKLNPNSDYIRQNIKRLTDKIYNKITVKPSTPQAKKPKAASNQELLASISALNARIERLEQENRERQAQLLAAINTLKKS